MNDQKRRGFMEKLQALKAQEKWSDADYAVNAKTYVQDEKIAAFDAKGKALLEKVQALGGGDSLTDDKRCAMLGDLKGLLADVVKNTREKWDYMFAKLSGALKPVTASPAAAPKPQAGAAPKAQTSGAAPKPQASGAAPKPQAGATAAAKPQAGKPQAGPAAVKPVPSPSSAPPKPPVSATTEEWPGTQ